MFTKDNLQKLEQKNVKFIVAAKLKGLKKSQKEEILSDIKAAKTLDPELSNWCKEYDLDGRRLVVNYSSKRAAKDAKDRERLVERVKKKMKNGKVPICDLINNTGTKKYLKIDKNGTKTASLNQEKIDLATSWDGLHGVITNHSQDSESSESILQRYRGLWQIEEAFRINKHTLKMRPIYHWTPRRIKAHILICFVAFALVAFTRKQLKQKGLNISCSEIREELTRVQASTVIDKSTGQRFILPSRVNQVQKTIYSAFGIKLSQKTALI